MGTLAKLLLFAVCMLIACVGLVIWRFDGTPQGGALEGRDSGFWLFLYGACGLLLLAVGAAIDAWRGPAAGPPPGESTEDAERGP
jgi:hypothetical protein